MAVGVKARFLVAGRMYRDLDGSLVELISVERGLCSWVATTDAEKNRQITHQENFRRRFESFDDKTSDFPVDLGKVA
jgi:hypothetical protein